MRRWAPAITLASLLATACAGSLVPAFDARLLKVGDQTVKTGGFDNEVKKTEILIGNEALAKELVAEAEQQSFIVSEVTTKERKRNPVPPFITSKLQQEASRKLRFPVRKTMQLAQKLYEGIEIGDEGVGVILYIRHQEGRGIGLLDKLHAYNLQDKGFDTVEANEALGHPPDKRDYGIGSQILYDLGVRKIRLLTNNPKKIYGLEGFGLEVVERVPIRIQSNPHNERYLKTKKDKLGHLL